MVAQELPYRFDPLVRGDLGGAGGQANACGFVVGAQGQATVGKAGAIGGGFHAFYEDEHGLEDLGTFGGPNSEAKSLGFLGEVVGWADALDGYGNAVPRAFRWDRTTGMVDLGDLGGERSWATGVDPYGGFICGTSEDAAGVLRAFQYNPNQPGLVDLGDLGGGTAAAHSAHAGVIVGESTTPNGDTHAFRWFPSSGMYDLGALAGGFSSATSVSINGYVCGWSVDGAGRDRAVFFQSFPSSDVIDCGTFGGAESYAYGVNNLGQVVGTAQAEDGSWRAFMWDDDHRVMMDLNDSIHHLTGWTLHSATHITDDGSITGVGSYNGHLTGFLLRPFSMSVSQGIGPTLFFTAGQMEPGDTVWFVGSQDLGAWQVPGLPQLELDLLSPRLVDRAQAEVWGSAHLSVPMPSYLSGRTVHFQATVPGRLLKSPVVTRTFW